MKSSSLSFFFLFALCLFLPSCAERQSVTSANLNAAVSLSCTAPSGGEYQVGESWMCADGCNTCSCELATINGQTYASVRQTQMMCYTP